MAGLVLEGGSLRGIFSAGIMDALIDHNVEFNYVIGVSAGISNGVSYISKQKGRNLEIMQRFRNDKRYLSKRNLLKCRSIFGLDFIFEEIPNKFVPFEWETYRNFKGSIKIGVTDVKTGQIVYKDGKLMDKKCQMLRATCAIPFYFPMILVDGEKCVDGGISDSIGIKQSLSDGNLRNLVILTQPEGYRKELTKSAKYGAKFYERKYPNLAKTMLNRHEMYNKTIDFLEKLERNSPEDIIILRPEYKLNSFEKNIENLEKNYKHGYDIGIKNIEKIKKLIEN